MTRELDWDDDVLPRIARLAEIARERIGVRAATEMARNLRRMKELGTPAESALLAVEQSIAALERQPRMGTRLPLPLAKALVVCGARKLEHLRDDDGRVRLPPLEIDEVTKQIVVAHAEALLPTFGEADAELCVRIAWHNLHTYWMHPIVGQAHNRNTTAATDALVEAWERQRAPTSSAPIGVVLASEGAPGVLYATSGERQEPAAVLDDRWAPRAFWYWPDDGAQPARLDTVEGLERFFSLVPLPITPRTLAWILHLVRLPFGVDDVVARDAALLRAWRPLEEKTPLGAAAALLGVWAPDDERREALELEVGDRVVRYAPGELSVA